jgi:hypothetical protein
MADSKITALTSIGASTDPANDPLVLVDVSDTSMAATGTTKKVTLNQLLGASGTATLASATITGDLTVDTSTLKVDSANNRVGIGLTSPNRNLSIYGASNSLIHFTTATTGPLNTDGFTFGVETDSSVALFNSENTPFNFYVNSTLGMTLNSTGLGVGVSPSYKLDVSSSSNIVGRVSSSSVLNTGFNIVNTTGSTWSLYSFGSNDATLQNSFGIYHQNGTSFLQITQAGNVGVGVTPSAWVSTFKALQISSYASFAGNSDDKLTAVSNNYYNDATAKFVGNGYAASYSQYQGAHRWQTSTVSNSSGAGAALTFNMNMVLDASGNLLVGTTSVGGVNGITLQPSATTPTVVTVGSASTGGTAYLLYSTGASANRFYVTYAGTVFATNTTISAISDARFKENVQDIDVGLGAILALKPRKFDWKAGKGKDIKGDRGFIAQEFEQVFPQLVDDWADPAPEGEAPYKSVRQDLIPVLVKAIQELAAEVNALKNA